MIFVLIANRPVHRLGNSAQADERYVVNIYENGQRKLVLTDSGTVGDVLAHAGLAPGQGDVVEPSTDTPIERPDFTINLYRATPVVIYDGQNRVVVQTGYHSPRQIAEAAGIKVYPEDIISLDRIDNFVADGSVGRKVIITRAKPVQLQLAGQIFNFRTQKSTLRQLLTEKGLQIQAKDVLNVDMDAPLYAGEQIIVNRFTQTIANVQQPVSYDTQIQYDANQYVGYNRVAQNGADGSQIVSYLVSLKDGAETGRSVISTQQTVAPTPKIIVRGSKVFVDVASYDSAGIVALAHSKATARGWDHDQWNDLYRLWSNESHFNPRAQNGSTGACGIPQALPCSRMPGFPDNAGEQIDWGLGYIAGRYGDPTSAWHFWQSNGWY